MVKLGAFNNFGPDLLITTTCVVTEHIMSLLGEIALLVNVTGRIRELILFNCNIFKLHEVDH